MSDTYLDGCVGKVPYATAAAAMKVAAVQAGKQKAKKSHMAKGRLRPYRCPHCAQWHLTSMSAAAVDHLKRRRRLLQNA